MKEITIAMIFFVTLIWGASLGIHWLHPNITDAWYGLAATTTVIFFNVVLAFVLAARLYRSIILHKICRRLEGK